MDLDKLAVMAKTSEKHLVKLIERTKKYRYISRRFPDSTRKFLDIDGELIALTWEIVKRYDVARGCKFVTLLLTSYKYFLAREWTRYSRRKHAGMLGISLNGIGDNIYARNGRRLSPLYSRSLDSHFELKTDVIDFLKNTLFGSEKLLFVRAIINKGRIADIAKECGISIRRAYDARRNIIMLARIYTDGGIDPEIAELFRLSVSVRGICDGIASSITEEEEINVEW